MTGLEKSIQPQASPRPTAYAALPSTNFTLPTSAMWIGRLHLSVSFMEVCPTIFFASGKLTPVSTRCWSLCKALHSDHYAQDPAMCIWPGADNAGPYDGLRSRPAKSAHSYSVCRNRMSESGARYRRILVSGASRRPRAYSFIARSAST